MDKGLLLAILYFIFVLIPYICYLEYEDRKKKKERGVNHEKHS